MFTRRDSNLFRNDCQVADIRKSGFIRSENAHFFHSLHVVI